MDHQTSLIATIAAGFGLAFLFGLLMHRVHLPAIFGYLLAGIVIGPFSPGFVADTHLANQLAELGVVLLMFGVGLHFSIADLMRVRTIAVPGAVIQILVATFIGAMLAYSWGWHWSAGLVFGLSLSVASTIVLLRSLEDRQLARTQRAQIAIGWLIVEDLAMIVVLVLLPVLAQIAPQNTATATIDVSALLVRLASTLGKVAIFVALMLLVGKRVIPHLLQLVVRIRSRELFTLSVLAVALGIAYGSALLFDVSLAIGAFFAGVVLSESELSHKAAEDILPMRDAFAVLFFVSVGMLFDPRILLEQPWRVVAVVLVIVVGNSIVAFATVLVRRYPLRTALIVAAGVAQIGEFSFILIGLGLTLNLVPREAQGLILAGAICSIALNPVIFSLTVLLERRIRAAPRLFALLDHSSNSTRGDLASVVPHDCSGHVVIVGYGRVGSMIGAALQERNVPYVVVEVDRKLVDRLTSEGKYAVSGDIADSAVLQSVALERARMLAFAIPDSVQLRFALNQVKSINPSLVILARTHTTDDAAFLKDAGVALVLLSERELGLQMAHYALINMGVEKAVTEQTLDRVRASL